MDTSAGWGENIGAKPQKTRHSVRSAPSGHLQQQREIRIDCDEQRKNAIPYFCVGKRRMKWQRTVTKKIRRFVQLSNTAYRGEASS